MSLYIWLMLFYSGNDIYRFDLTAVTTTTLNPDCLYIKPLVPQTLQQIKWKIIIANTYCLKS